MQAVLMYPWSSPREYSLANQVLSWKWSGVHDISVDWVDYQRRGVSETHHASAFAFAVI
jgi:hypothetical protein